MRERLNYKRTPDRIKKAQLSLKKMTEYPRK
jgi:hypothetical protein